MNWYENKLLERIDGGSGKIVEENYLGNIDSDLYVEKYKEIMFDPILAYKLYGKLTEDPRAMLKHCKEHHPEQYKRYKKEYKDVIEKEILSRLGKKGKFSSELYNDEQFEIVEKSQKQYNYTRQNQDKDKDDIDKNEEFKDREYDVARDPEKKFANDLHATIMEKLDMGCEDLEYYSAVDTHLDYCGGIDAFFKFYFKNEQGETDFVRVSFDITINTEDKKREQLDAKGYTTISSDLVVFVESENYRRSDDKAKKLIDKYSDEIIEIFKKRKKEKQTENNIKNWN